MKRPVALVAIGIVAILLAGASAETADLQTDFKMLELKLSLNPARILPGEPVSYQVTLRNSTTRPLPGDLELELDQDLGLWTRADGSDWRYYSGSDQGVPILMPRTLDQVLPLPGGSQRETTGVMQALRDHEHPDVKSYAFAEPGRYEAKARVLVPVDLEGNTVVLESDPVELIVEQPLASGDQAVWEVLRARPESAWFLQHGYVGNWVGDPRNPELAATLEALLSKYPEGRYAQTIRDSLRRHRDLRVRHKLQR